MLVKTRIVAVYLIWIRVLYGLIYPAASLWSVLNVLVCDGGWLEVLLARSELVKISTLTFTCSKVCKIELKLLLVLVKL